jgi:hypothetical protein
MAKFNVGDKLIDTQLNWEIEILMVAPEVDSEGFRSYFIKITEKDNDSFLYDTADEPDLELCMKLEKLDFQ